MRGDWTASFHWSPHLSLSAIVGYDTAPSAAEGGSLAAFAGGAEQIFAAGALTAVIGQQTLRLLAGSLRGGLLCADGVCKMLPPFTGLRAELSVQL